MIKHPCFACPECDDVQNDACQSCEGTDQYCPICGCPARNCEFVNDIDDELDDDPDINMKGTVSDGYDGPDDGWGEFMRRDDDYEPDPDEDDE